eukprot:gene4995-6219_t
MSTKPNFFILLAAQAISVIGDSFGQRCSRVNYKHSVRHMMIGLCLMTSIQMFIIMGILQLALPSSISGAIYIDNVKVDCYYELDVEGKIMDCTPTNCTQIPCKSQGPFSMFKSIALHPFLLTNGLMNIIYYNGEVFLYKEPLGLLFLVIAALSSTYLFGIAGSILSVIEFKPKSKPIIENNVIIENPSPINNSQEDQEENQNLLNNDEENISIDTDEDDHNNNNNNNENNNENNGKEIIYDKDEEYQIIHRHLPHDSLSKIEQQENISRDWSTTIKNTLLRANALWMETSLFYNDQFRTNAFGYNSLDQVLLPIYLFFFMVIVDIITPLKKLFLNEEDQKENLIQACKTTWKESSLINLFIYRLLINGRAIQLNMI